MSIFRRRREAAEPVAPSTPSPARMPDWQPVHGGAGQPSGPAPYYVAGMPSLHPDDTDGAAPDAGQDTSHADAPAPRWGEAEPTHTPAPEVEPEPAALAAPPQVPADAGVDDPSIDPTTEHPVEKPVEQVAPVSRGGRNMPIATLVGVSLLALVVVAAWWHPLAFAALVVLFSLAAVIEWRSVLAKQARRVPLVPVALATAGFVVATWSYGTEGLVVALMAGLAGTVAWRVVDERIENTLADSLAAMLTLLWIPFLASFLVLLVMAEDGWHRVMIVILAVAGSDTGGLFAGMLFGKHPMAPRVSPKKTWEGFAGGLVLGTAAAAVAAYYFYDGDWWIGAIVGVACGLAAVLGDLAESAVKRDIQVKDMSSLLPGHGGIMDRIDSLLLAAPVAFVAFAVLTRIS